MLSRTGARSAVGSIAAALTLLLPACAGAASQQQPTRSQPAASRTGTHAKDRFFGMHAPDLATAFPQAPVGAVDLTTNAVYWPQLEPSPGRFDFSRLDSLVAQARSHGAKPMLVLGQTPTFHATRPHAAPVSASVPKLRPWKKYVRKVAGRYGAKLDYGIWPEPNIKSNWAGTKPQLAKLVASASKIIHDVASHAIVVSSAFVLRLPGERQWMNKFFATRVGGKRIGTYVDAVGLDPYPLQKGLPEDSMPLIHAARKILRSHRVKAPVWNVEINYGVKGSNQPISHHSSSHLQAAYVVRTYLLNAAANVKRVYWLGWFHPTTMDVQMVSNDGSATPAGKAYGVVYSWLHHQHLRSCKKDVHNGLYTCLLTRAGHKSRVYWVPKGKAQTVRAPAHSRHYQTIGGAEKPTHRGKKLLVTKAPIYVYN